VKYAWGSPENYRHIALRDVRRVDILWDEEETADYEAMKPKAQEYGESMSDYIKRKLKDDDT
jgi:hypothetical protein